jgi:hypothetical protein
MKNIIFKKIFFAKNILNILIAREREREGTNISMNFIEFYK